jgi:hypothetical protein
LFLVRRFLSPWWRRRQVPPKRRFLQEPHGVTTQKTPFFYFTLVYPPTMKMEAKCSSETVICLLHCFITKQIELFISRTVEILNPSFAKLRVTDQSVNWGRQQNQVGTECLIFACIYNQVQNIKIKFKLRKIWGFHGNDYEECRLLGYKNPVRTSQETHYVSATESSQLMLCKIWGCYGSDYEECRLVGS